MYRVFPYVGVGDDSEGARHPVGPCGAAHWQIAYGTLGRAKRA